MRYLFFLNDSELDAMDCNVVLEDALYVGDVFLRNDGQVNDIDLSREALAINSYNFPTSLTFEKVETHICVVNKLNDIVVNSLSLQNITVNFSNLLPPLICKKAEIQHNFTVQTVNGVM